MSAYNQQNINTIQLNSNIMLDINSNNTENNKNLSLQSRGLLLNHT